MRDCQRPVLFVVGMVFFAFGVAAAVQVNFTLMSVDFIFAVAAWATGLHCAIPALQ